MNVKPHEVTDGMELFWKTGKQTRQPTDSCSISYSGGSIPPSPNTSVEEQHSTAPKEELIVDTDTERF